MFGELIPAYLFLAGTGAGGVAAASIIDLVFARIPFGLTAVTRPFDGRPLDRLISLVFAASVGALVLGVACLMVDLGRVDRIFSLFFPPVFTLMSLGTWALTALLAVVGILTLQCFLYLSNLKRPFATVLEIFAIMLACVVALYAGLLLQGLAGVRLWTSFWVPVLFVLSAASCGCALVIGCALFVDLDREVTVVVRRVLSLDVVVIVLELAAATVFLGNAVGANHPGVVASTENLLHGKAALSWWCGFVLCGVLLPLCAEVVLLLRERICLRRESLRVPNKNGKRFVKTLSPANKPNFTMDSIASSWILAALAALVLVGGVGLRWAVVEAGEQRPLELQEVPKQKTENDTSPAAVSFGGENVDCGESGDNSERDEKERSSLHG